MPARLIINAMSAYFNRGRKPVTLDNGPVRQQRPEQALCCRNRSGDRAKPSVISRRGAERYRRVHWFGTVRVGQDAYLQSGLLPLDHLHEVPVYVIRCIEGRIDRAPGAFRAGKWPIILAAWSAMLAAWESGLGIVWTSFRLNWEQEASEILGSPCRCRLPLGQSSS